MKTVIFLVSGFLVLMTSEADAQRQIRVSDYGEPRVPTYSDNTGFVPATPPLIERRRSPNPPVFYRYDGSFAPFPAYRSYARPVRYVPVYYYPRRQYFRPSVIPGYLQVGW
jgi:hypothetical protein